MHGCIVCMHLPGGSLSSAEAGKEDSSSMPGIHAGFMTSTCNRYRSSCCPGNGVLHDMMACNGAGIHAHYNRDQPDPYPRRCLSLHALQQISCCMHWSALTAQMFSCFAHVTFSSRQELHGLADIGRISSHASIDPAGCMHLQDSCQSLCTAS